jgi:hypothetical protein
MRLPARRAGRRRLPTLALWMIAAIVGVAMGIAHEVSTPLGVILAESPSDGNEGQG